MRRRRGPRAAVAADRRPLAASPPGDRILMRGSPACGPVAIAGESPLHRRVRPLRHGAGSACKLHRSTTAMGNRCATRHRARGTPRANRKTHSCDLCKVLRRPGPVRQNRRSGASRSGCFIPTPTRRRSQPRGQHPHAPGPCPPLTVPVGRDMRLVPVTYRQPLSRETAIYATFIARKPCYADQATYKLGRRRPQAA